MCFSFRISSPSRLLYTALVGCFLLPRLALGAQLAVDSSTLSPGASGTVSVSYQSLGDQVSAIQFDIEFSSSVMSVLATPASVIRSTGKNIYGADLVAGKHRVLIAGLNRNLLTDGPLVTLFVNVLNSAGSGTYGITITNALGADPSGNAVSITSGSGAITISGQPGNVAAIQPNEILNSASLLAGAVSPGEVVTLMGSGIGPLAAETLQLLPSGLVSANLSNTTVSFDSVEAPLVYVGLNQINAVVPFEVAGQSSTVLTIVHDGQKTPPVPIAVAPSTPAIFTQEATGIGQAAALNEDGSLNTPLNPADQGSVVTVYFTGAGQTKPPGTTGGVTMAAGELTLTTTATIGGLPADVVYSGPAPGLVAGVNQINLRVPPGAASSFAAPISIRVGNAVTQDGVALSLR